jgi:UDPglucose--hexose-1-phosphate uridylyltransferase
MLKLHYFYHIALCSNYIRTAQIAKNLSWKAPTEYGNIEITINLTKPEKDPRTIALERMQPQRNYPKCLLCLDNIGYSGRINYPARQTHRVIPLTLDGEEWYLQYSPYVYYNEHCIVFSHDHYPMTISKRTFTRQLDFVRQFPHYFCGSNADLPIVGGSILSHNHFQGGGYTFPIHRAQTLQDFKYNKFPGVSVSALKWPLTVIRAASKSKEELIEFSDHLYNKWKEYSDPEYNILAYSESENGKVPHNTVTPIARINPEGLYEIDLVLRNNRTTEEYPFGIFHPHQEIHHIKKENIGLIEVMGLAILPGRLYQEGKEIKEILKGNKCTPSIQDKDNILVKHLDWIKELMNKYGTGLTEKSADKVLREEIGNKFKTCLEHCGVFKQDEQGKKGLIKFMETID